MFFYSAECQDRSCALCWTDRTCRGTAVWVQGRQRPPQSHPAALMSTRWPACILPLHRSQYFLDTRCHSHNYSPRGLLWCNGWSWTLRTLQRQHRPCSLFPHSLRDFRVTFSVKFGGEKKKTLLLFINSFCKIPLKTFPEFSDRRCKGVLVVDLFGKERSVGNRRILPKKKEKRKGYMIE